MSSLQQYFSTLDSAYDLKGCSHINQMCFNSKDRQKATLKIRKRLVLKVKLCKRYAFHM